MSDAWLRFCRSNQLEPSMSGRETAGNAVADPSAVKKERIKKQIYKTERSRWNDVADYIDRFYNQTRRHSHWAA